MEMKTDVSTAAGPGRCGEQHRADVPAAELLQLKTRSGQDALRPEEGA